MKRRTGAIAGLVALGAVLPLMAPAGAEPVTACSFSDPAGDTGFIADIGAGIMAESALDIVQASADWSEQDQTLTFSIEVADLNDLGLPPLGANGEYFDFNFTLNGEDYTAQYYNSRADGDISWRLAYYGELGRTTLATSANSNITGTADVLTDTITIVVPAIVEHQTNGVVLELTDDSAITALEVVSRREIVVLVPDADTAAPSAGCTGITVTDVRGGTVEGLEIGDSVTTSHAILVDAQGQCEVDPCVRESFLVDATEGTLVVRLANVTDEHGLTDLDLFLSGVGGKHESVSVGNAEEIRIPLAPGRKGGYIASVYAHTAVDTTFDLVVSVEA